MAGAALLELPADLLLHVLSRLGDADRALGAVDLVCFARTCRAANRPLRGGQPGLCQQAACAILGSPGCVALRAAAAESKADAELRVVDGPAAGRNWLRELYTFDCSLWRALEPVELNLGCKAVAPGAAVRGGVPHLVTGSASGLMLWAAHTDRCSVTLLPSARTVDVVAVVQSGLVAAAAADTGGLVRLLDLADGGSAVRHVQTGCASVSALGCLGDVVIAAGEDTLVACFAAPSGVLFPALLAHAPGQASVSACGSIVAVGSSESIHVFEQSGPGERPQLLAVLGGDAASASAIALLPTGILAAADWWGEVHVWTHAAPKAGAVLAERWLPRLSFDAFGEAHDTDCCGLTLSTCHERFLATGHRWGASISIWNCLDGTLISTVGAPDGVLCFGCSSSMILASSGGGSVRIWRPRQSQALCGSEAERVRPSAGSGSAGDVEVVVAAA